MSVECQSCYRQFIHPPAAMQHMDDVNHWQTKYDCRTCGNRFMFERHLMEHKNRESHWSPTTHETPHWCFECQRGFQNENSLRQHRNGSAHRAGSISCPFCREAHTTASGVVHHLETGSCPNAKALNREKIFEVVNRADNRGIITNKQLTWHASKNGDHIASAASWNGRSYECYMCHKGYQSLGSLNQHLHSPAHKQKIYHCLGRACTKQFTALAQLFNHLESESCGATRFDVVQQNASAILTGRRMIAF